MPTSPVQHRGREVPWRDLVRFHKEVVARAEEDFFSLEGGNAQDERWTSLNGFEPESLAGPWNLGESALASEQFLLAMAQGQHETLYLGGPCYLGWHTTMQDQKVPRWRPLFYREVTASRLDGRVQMTPAQGNWHVSPLIRSSLSRAEVAIGDALDALVTRVFESAERERNRPASQRLLEAFLARVPSLSEEVTQEVFDRTFRVRPSAWVLFAPATRMSALNRHLYQDYVRLEEVLERTPDQIGGLRAFEDVPAAGTVTAGPEILPLVPLNSQQHRAVQAVLKGAPLTVISGPPGTGKSQVVVSLLLNAWAQGKSVLFASNNNKAVDVVRERLEQFEAEFPIAVRAGSLKNQNIADVLRKTLHMGTLAGAEVANTTAARQGLLAKMKVVRDELASGVPQRVDEALRAALQAYAKCERGMATLAQHEASLLQEHRSLRLDQIEPAGVVAALDDTRRWLDRVSVYRDLEAQDALQRREHEAEAALIERKRNARGRDAGLEAVDAGDWTWLLNGPSSASVTAWENDLRTLLQKPLEGMMVELEWRAEFDRWRSSAAARTSAIQARDLAAAIVTARHELEPRWRGLKQVSRAVEAARGALAEHGLAEDVEVPASLFTQWSAAFNELVTLEPSAVEWVPWSAYGRLDRRMRECERQILPHLPSDVVLRIGRLDREGRSRLAPLLSACRKWADAMPGRRKLQAFEDDALACYDQLRAASAALRIRECPTDGDPTGWNAVIDQCERLASDAEQAALAWEKREGLRAAEDELRRLSVGWEQLGAGTPLRKAWRGGIGKAFDAAVRRAGDRPDADAVVTLRGGLYSGVVSQWREVWEECAEAQGRIVELRQRSRAVPEPGARALEWLEARPARSVADHQAPGKWPDVPALKGRLDEVAAWCERWARFVQQEKPQLEQTASIELDWITQQLTQLLALLPGGTPERTRIEELLTTTGGPLTAASFKEVQELLRPFSMDALKAEVARLERALERSSFDDAKASWLHRLRTDAELMRAVDDLERTVNRNRNNVPESAYEVFRRALGAVPVWITTAQSSQAIPLEPDLFDVVVIDEASQCTLTNLLPLVYRGKTLAVIGDERQLPAISSMEQAQELDLAGRFGVESHLALFGHAETNVYATAAQSLPRRRADVITLVEHFRSHPLIIGFSNRHIYQRALELKKPPSAGRTMPIPTGLHAENVRGSAERGKGGSWWNRAEAERVVTKVQDLLRGNSRGLSLGVVTPFRAQKKFLMERFSQMGCSDKVFTDTANGFQGDERDVIIFSPVVSEGIGTASVAWVETPPNLVNVALTRARDALVVVADLEFCARQEGILRDLATYCRDVQLLRDTSPAELELFSWMVVKGWAPTVHPVIGDVEVDFMLPLPAGRRLAIEVDGRTHLNTMAVDDFRDAFLRAQGYDVLRLSARSVLETPFEVIHQIDQKHQQAASRVD